MNIFLFLGGVFLLILILGKLLEKFRIPWIFAALLLGAFLAIYNPFEQITTSPAFNFLANLGMYFLLFIIGFEINLKNIKRSGFFIFKVSLATIFLTAFVGASFIHYIFNYSWFISFLVGLSFATVGEAILIPILDEFKIINSKLGQVIIGSGTLDDIVEVFALVVLTLFLGSQAYGRINTLIIFAALLVLFILTLALSQLKSQGVKFKVSSIETLFLFIIAVFFIFLGIGQYAEAAALGAILAGVGLKTFIPNARLKAIENEVKAVCYGLFAPIFFLWAGLSMDMHYLITYPLLILLLVIVVSASKYLGSYLVAKKQLGLKQSILLGTGLSVRFSTSIVIIKILFENKIIANDLYSVIVASSVLFALVVPILFSVLLAKWKLVLQKNF